MIESESFRTFRSPRKIATCPVQYPIEALEGPVLHRRAGGGRRIVESAISTARHLKTAADFETIRHRQFNSFASDATTGSVETWKV